MKKSISAAQALAVRNRTLEVAPEWRGCLGDVIARHGIVFIWGNSGNGKSSAVMSFARMLSEAGKVLYVSKEEGFERSFQDNLLRAGMQDCGKNFQIVGRTETFESLKERLAKPKSPEFVIIDSVQAMGIGTKQYRELKELYCSKKMLVLVSWTDGKRPDGRPAVHMMYDADLKLWVEGHIVFSKGRFMGETREFVTWPEGAKLYWDGRKKEY